jgi:hypothetical protein
MWPLIDAPDQLTEADPIPGPHIWANQRPKTRYVAVASTDRFDAPIAAF